MNRKPTYTKAEISLAKNLAERVRKLRESKGLTQERLAQLAEVTTPTYQRLEKGFSASGEPLNPKAFTLLRVCRALGITLSELLEGLDNYPIEEETNPNNLQLPI